MDKRLLLIRLGMLVAGSAAAADTPAQLPEPTTSGDVTYLTGGVGKDEVDAIKAAEKDYPLTLEFAVKDSTQRVFTADVDVKLTDSKGETVLDTVSEGPFLLAKLPSGRYRVEASQDGVTKVKHVTVSENSHQKVLMVWSG